MLLFAMQHAQDACAIVRSAQSIDLRRGCVAWWSAPFVFVPSVCNAAQSDPERNTSEGQLASSACVCTMHLDRFTRHPWVFHLHSSKCRSCKEGYNHARQCP
jgi:hypothetical protein